MIELTENSKELTIHKLNHLLLARACWHLYNYLEQQRPVKKDANAITDVMEGLATQMIREFVERIELTEEEKIEAINTCSETIKNMSVEHLSELLEVTAKAGNTL